MHEPYAYTDVHRREHSAFFATGSDRLSDAELARLQQFVGDVVVAYTAR